MTLEIGKGVELKTWFDPDIDVNIYVPNQKQTVEMRDFLAGCYYVLTNSNLLPENDPRIVFVNLVKQLKIGKGFEPSKKRLVYKTEKSTNSLYYPGWFKDETEKLMQIPIEESQNAVDKDQDKNPDSDHNDHKNI